MAITNWQSAYTWNMISIDTLILYLYALKDSVMYCLFIDQLDNELCAARGTSLSDDIYLGT